MTRNAWRWQVIAVGTVLSMGSLAHAAEPRSNDATAACLAANERAQTLRAQHKLSQSVDQLRVCSQTSCPPAVQRDCVQWLHEVEAALPTLSFSAKNGKGEDLTNVTVWLDGTQIVDGLTGNSVPVDPGQHTFRFDHEGEPSVNRDILVSEGDKARKIEVRFGQPETPPGTPGASKPVPVAPIVVGAIGAVGLLGGLILFAERRSAIPDRCKDTVEVQTADGSANQCQPGATQADVDSAKSAADASYVGLGIAIGGGALLATGLTWLIVDRATPAPKENTARVRVRPTFGLGAVGFTGTF